MNRPLITLTRISTGNAGASAATLKRLAAGRKQVQRAAESEKPPVVKKSKKKRKR